MQNTPAPNVTARLSGVLSPVLTPFGSDLRPDPVRFVAHCRWLLSQGVGLAMFGTNSEGNSLSIEEKTGLLETLVTAGIPMGRAMPGTGSCSLVDAVELTRTCVQIGTGGVLVLPPFYYKDVTEDGLFAFYAELIERIGNPDLRIYLYHIPTVSGVAISRGLIERLLARYPGVVAGIKDTGGNWDHTARLIAEFGPHGFDVFAGTETVLLDVMRAGGPGCITATANVNPSRIVDLYRNWQRPDADERQRQLIEERNHFARFQLIPAMKAAVAGFLGDDGWTRVRPPLKSLSPENQQELMAVLRRHDFSMPGLLASA